jgi:hypothetical protein
VSQFFIGSLFAPYYQRRFSPKQCLSISISTVLAHKYQVYFINLLINNKFLTGMLFASYFHFLPYFSALMKGLPVWNH